MATADLTRRISSGGAYGYYDGWPTGDIGIGSAAFESGLHNTWKVSRDLASGSTVEIVFGQQSADPSIAPLPNLFDVNLSFSGSIEVYNVDVAGLTLTSDTLTISIGIRTVTYTRGNLGTLNGDLIDFGVPQATADDFVSVVAEAMDATGQIEAWAFEFYNSLDFTDLSNMVNLVNIDLTSSMATSSVGGTAVNIGSINHVTSTAYDDKVIGNTSTNILHGGAGNDYVIGGSSTDFLDGDDGNDVLYGGIWAELDQSGQAADPTKYEDDGVKDYLVGGSGVEKYYASAFDEITDATIHAVD